MLFKTIPHTQFELVSTHDIIGKRAEELVASPVRCRVEKEQDRMHTIKIEVVVDQVVEKCQVESRRLLHHSREVCKDLRGICTRVAPAVNQECTMRICQPLVGVERLVSLHFADWQ